MDKLEKIFFDDVGGILKMISIPIWPVGAAFLLITGFYMLTKARHVYESEKYVLLGIVLIISTVVVPQCLAYIVYGFGEMIDIVTEIEKHLPIK